MSTVASRYTFRQHLEGVGDTGATVSLTFETVATGRQRRFDRVGLLDVETAITKARMIMGGHGYDHVLWEENTLTANVLYWDPYPFTLIEGEYLVIELTGTVDADNIDAYAIGVDAPMGEVL